MYTIRLEKGYRIMQDVHGLGECFHVYNPDFNAYAAANSHCISPFEPIDRLGHLQLLFSEHPYYGRENRYFNYAPWWYRIDFEVPADAPDHCVLRVGAADYFCDVYLNGNKLGSHEGYFASFEFCADEFIRRGEINTCVLKVSAPWDEEKHDGANPDRCWNIVRNQIKGTYEHADSFLSRDINPIGLLKCVELDFFDNARIRKLDIHAQVIGNVGKLTASAEFDGHGGTLRARLYNQRTGELVAKETALEHFEILVTNVELWQCPEHGSCGLYRLEVDLLEDDKVIQTVKRSIGFRTIELRRTKERTEYYLNGKRLYIRGTTYFPEVFVSRMDLRKYRHDLQLLRDAGINMIRIHVHVENPEFYDLCDELGMLVMQDSDLNWVSVRSDAFTARVLGVFSEMLDLLGSHPCIATWVLFNEPDRGNSDYFMSVQPAPQMEDMAHDRFPEIPTIRGSYVVEELHSGDSHNYTGSLYGENQHYLDKVNNEKFNTEFGFDAPASLKNLQSMPELARVLNLTQEEIDEVDYYQYRLIKHFIDDYRSHKYDKCSGYMQFLFTDPLPTSFFGAIDWWGSLKGAFQAMKESNQPVSTFYTCSDKPGKLYAVNDTQWDINAKLCAFVTDADGKLVEKKEYDFLLGKDSLVELGELNEVKKGSTVFLRLYNMEGKTIAENRYVDPLTHPSHPLGHPGRMNNEYGMHLYRLRTN